MIYTKKTLPATFLIATLVTSSLYCQSDDFDSENQTPNKIIGSDPLSDETKDTLLQIGDSVDLDNENKQNPHSKKWYKRTIKSVGDFFTKSDWAQSTKKGANNFFTGIGYMVYQENSTKKNHPLKFASLPFHTQELLDKQLGNNGGYRILKLNDKGITLLRLSSLLPFHDRVGPAAIPESVEIADNYETITFEENAYRVAKIYYEYFHWNIKEKTTLICLQTEDDKLVFLPLDHASLLEKALNTTEKNIRYNRKQNGSHILSQKIFIKHDDNSIERITVTVPGPQSLRMIFF